jgi:bifunctional non-homologous end joining protein LigD
VAKRGESSALKAYEAKRDFSKSPEPAPKMARKAATKAASFCVQKHLASHLHYDFRLEHAGVLLSWAVPKGPSLNPADKRLAMHVEDHPVAYGDFEGVIPSGYGAGIVMLWDRGTWTPEPGFEDVDAGLKKGELKFKLDGVKLKGSWVLVRTRQRFSGPEQWLLIKHRDKWSGEIEVTAEAPLSVKSFGDLADIATANDEVPEWRTKPPVKGGETGKLFAEVMKAAGEIRSGERKPTAKAKKSVWQSNKPAHRDPHHGRATHGRGKAAKGHERDAHATKKNKAATRTLRPVVAPKLDKSALKIGANQPKLSNPQKVMYPATGFTKGEMVNYYTRIAPLILPHLVGRAATLKRYPDGVDGEFFFEKRCNKYRPDWVKTVRVPLGDGHDTIDFCEIGDLATLQWAANLAAIEMHVPLAYAADPDTPTAMIFDLDPGEGVRLKELAPIALRLRDMLEHFKLKSMPKTSGGKGIHILVPFNTPGVTFEETKSFARAVALTLEQDDPKRILSSMTRSQRKGKVFVDWGQNDRNKTNACVFSLRARPEPTISWPLEWGQLESRKAIKPVRADDKLDLAHAKQAMKVLSAKQKLPAVSS